LIFTAEEIGFYLDIAAILIFKTLETFWERLASN